MNRKIKVLWFEVSTPYRIQNSKIPIAGWQDSLEDIVRNSSDIELGIAFESSISNSDKKIDGVSYFPISINYSLIDKISNKYSCRITCKKQILKAVEVVERFKPDIIHVFGSEWCWGQIVQYTDIPVVIHMQGSIPSYFNARFPPNYNVYDELFFNGVNIFRSISAFLQQKRLLSWKEQEEKTLGMVSNYMGRTCWDKNIVKLHNPNARYYYCSEALRSCFLEESVLWKCPENSAIQLITVGCSSYWKGLDTIIRTAKILKNYGINFEWKIAGKMNLKSLIEFKEKIKFDDVNVNILGFVDAYDLRKLLQKSDMYIHTAYIDNSPNSICEAQCIGIPIIATYVGGIPSLIENGKDGILVPANDPYTLAGEIIKLSFDKKRQIEYSLLSRSRALKRHNPSAILHDLLSCYNTLLSK